ncbi:hypothetical protein [Lactococcus allomyrinae]|nr:hypothetical protein [Lactococcus allomyrinae]
MDKIDEIIAKNQGFFKGSSMTTFVELKNSWFNVWQTTLKPQTIKRDCY